MKRKIYNDLLTWKKSTYRKPLILEGARQIGKTYIVNLFGQNEYDNIVYCNLEQEDNIKYIFENNSLIPSTIFKKISLEKNQQINPNNTLIFLDEIQSCPRALTFLKYVNEQVNDYHIIASGSLLGIAVNRTQNSYPVGKVTHMWLYPMDFEEFLWALNRNDLVEEIKKCYVNNKNISPSLHEQLLNLCRTFMFVGGMPEAVNKYITTENMNLVGNEQTDIILSYLRDMSKYNTPTNCAKTKLVYSKISDQLSKPNSKFKYCELKHGARTKEYELALEWICMTGIANKLNCLKNVAIPFADNTYDDCFKLYANDTGLLCKQKQITLNEVLDPNKISYFKGSLCENYVFNQLLVNGFNPYYWVSSNSAEVDFIIKYNDKIIPIEVKFNVNNKSKSLNVYIDTIKPDYAIKISAKNFGFENNIKSIPLYAVFCIKENE